MSLFRYETVLLIDNNPEDNLNTREAIVHSGLGHKVIVKVSGAEAIDYLTETDHFPDLIIFNNELPKFDGETYLCELESLPIIIKDRSKLIVMTSKKSQGEFGMLMKNRQIQGLLEKPLNYAACKKLSEDRSNNQGLAPEHPLALV